MKKILILIIALLPCLLQANPPSWKAWLKQLKQEAVDQGIRPRLFNQIFANWQPSRKVVRLDRNQPEQRVTFLQYRKKRGDAYRIKLGRRELKKHRALLNEISHQYGVSPCFILSFWGLETSYGRYMGRFSTFKALATLAYDGRRSEFFRKELMYALHIVNDGHIHHSKLKGEWAGATGHPQFLPSSWRHYAVDHNGDGKKDIWNNIGDVFASIANYLTEHGWQYQGPWAKEVQLHHGYEPSTMNLRYQQPVNSWLNEGVHFTKHATHINPQAMASVIRPDGGPDFMVFNNFRVIMKWNHSIYYAGTVGYVADKICRRS
jgi:membrane-bound lytic murein transglycosylase B